MNSKDKLMNENKTIQDPIPEIKDEELDTVAGGWTDGVEGADDSDRGFLHLGAVKAGIAVTTYLTCPQCGGAIINDPRYPHNCPAKKIPIR